MISGFLRDFRVLIQSSVFAVIFVVAVSGGAGGYQRATRSGPLRPSFLRSYVGIRRPHLVLGGMLRLRVARFLDIAILGNAVFFSNIAFF